MLSTVYGVVQNGQIQLLEPIPLPEGTKVLVTVVSEDESQFWVGASEPSAANIWDNPEDDIYAELLKE
jgi:hypothetical protein